MNEITENTMSSLDLVVVINEVRAQEGKGTLRHDNFMRKIETHPKITSPQFLGHVQVPGPNGAIRNEKCYFLPRREADLMVMSESRAVQAGVYDRMRALEVDMAKHLHQEIANAEARVRAEMLANQPVDLLEWLDSSSIVYFGKPGASSMEKRYFAVMEAEKLGYPTAARKYGLPMDTMQKWLKETTKESLREIGYLLASRCDPIKGIRYDLELEKAARDAARVEVEKAQKRLERKQLKLVQKEAVLKLSKETK